MNELEETQRLLNSRVHELEKEIQEKRQELEETNRQKQEYFSKWDFLETEYQLKCYAVHFTQANLNKAQDELKESNKTIRELERKFAAKNVSTVEVKASTYRFIMRN